MDPIGAGMRSFVNAALAKHPDLGDRQAISKKVRDAYNTRSRLLHDGHVPQEQLSADLVFLRDFAPRLLRVLFLEAASA